VREAGRIVAKAVTIAVGVNSDGRREVLGMDKTRLSPAGDRNGAAALTPRLGTRSRKRRLINMEHVAA
jgi:transposase-like protein